VKKVFETQDKYLEIAFYKLPSKNNFFELAIMNVSSLKQLRTSGFHGKSEGKSQE
jgi:hypothetical protein